MTSTPYRRFLRCGGRKRLRQLPLGALPLQFERLGSFLLDANGLPSFERLQSRINVGRATDIERVARGSPVVFMAFDVLKLDGRELTRTALRIRKKTLRELIRPAPQLVFVDHVENDGVAFFAELKRAGAEGMLAKRADSLYQPGARTGDWLKVKAWHTQSCAVIGWTAGQGRRGEHLGALILSVLRDGELRHCGQVGTGFTQRLLRDLRRQLEALRSDTPAVDPPPRTGEPATWVRPELVCEVRFAGWTAQGVLRHPAFVRLRPDQTVDDCSPEHEIVVAALLGARANARRGGSARREPAPGSSANAQRTGSSAKEQRRGGSDSGEIDEALVRLRTLHGNAHWEVAGRRLALTNLDKVLWPQDGITKRDMIEYYVRMSAYLLPYLRDRPLSMQVFPDGIYGKSFWRKDKPSHAPKWIDSWTYRGEKTKTYIVVNEVATLGWVANAGVIDLHPWHSRIDAADQPDWAVFDLDPFEPATFHDVIDIAKLVKAALDHYKLHGVIKTSGQTGLQIYVPLRRGPDYTAVRSWVEDVGRAIGQVAPERISWEWEVSRRSGKIRIDYTQNIINKTLAAPYSLRPAAKAPVSSAHWKVVPVSLVKLKPGAELLLGLLGEAVMLAVGAAVSIVQVKLDEPKLRPDGWNIATIADRVAAVGDLFVPVLAGDQPLPASG